MSTGLLGSSHPHKGTWVVAKLGSCVQLSQSLWSNGSKKGLDRFREGKSMVAVKLGGLDTTPGLERISC